MVRDRANYKFPSKFIEHDAYRCLFIVAPSINFIFYSVEL